MRRILHLLFACHLMALLFGLGGLLIALPYPELWNKSPLGQDIFTFGMTYTGSLHIVFGAAAVFLFGWFAVGHKKTVIFFAASTLISLSMELLGTSTGFPFGAYSYTSFLGYKIFGLVPYSIPLSWFYMGFTSYILASVLTQHFSMKRRGLWNIIIGSYFLTAWDLSLDPAMASDQLSVLFWNWQEKGPYFGMPLHNLLGWIVTGLIFMTASRLLWRSEIQVDPNTLWLPAGIYYANTFFSMGLLLGEGIWPPALMSVLCGLLPLTLILWLVKKDGKHPPTSPHKHPPTSPQEKVSGNQPHEQERPSISRQMSFLTVRTAGRMLCKRHVELHVEGLEYVPTQGPVLIVAHHVHHLYDGCIFLQVLTRQPHILVALDWIKQRGQRRLMEWACKMADWPIVLRTERLERSDTESAYTREEARSYLRRAVRQAIRLLRAGKLLVIFPEAYPNIDPTFTPKSDIGAFLRFRPGFARLAEIAERGGHTDTAIVPAGLSYHHNQRWHVTLRFGQALLCKHFSSTEECIRSVEQQVHALSQPRPETVAVHTQEAFQL